MQAHGARSGCTALGIFSCNGRTASLFGPETPLGASEAGIADRVLAHSVPFIGAQLGGEIGPSLHKGVWGVNMAEAALRRERGTLRRVHTTKVLAGDVGEGAAGGHGGAGVHGGESVRVGECEVELRGSVEHGFTSIYSMVGC